MKKRAFFAFLSTIATAACLAGGCGGGSGSSIIILDGVDRTHVSTLSVFGNRADRYSLSVMEDTLQKYMSENVIATYESARDRNYWQALDKRFETDNLDDIFWVERDRLLTMTQNGVLASLNDVVNANVFNDFARSQLLSGDSNIYAIPTAISTYGLYANYGLLDNKFDVPSNLEDFVTICEYFAEREITPVICNNYSSLSSLILAVGLYDTYCNSDTAGEIAKFNSNPALLSEPLNRGIDFVYRMIENGWIDLTQAALTGQGTGELELFASGNYPFMITGGWLSDTLKQYDTDFEYSILPYPVIEDDSVLLAQADLVSVKKGANEKEAKNLVSLLTRVDTLLLLNDNQSRFSPLRVSQTNVSRWILPSAKNLTNGKYVINSDIRLQIPLDSYLYECTNLILYKNADAALVKACLYDLLTGGSADE